MAQRAAVEAVVEAMVVVVEAMVVVEVLTILFAKVAAGATGAGRSMCHRCTLRWRRRRAWRRSPVDWRRSTVEMGPAPRLRERRPCRDRNPQRSRWWQRGAMVVVEVLTILFAKVAAGATGAGRSMCHRCTLRWRRRRAWRRSPVDWRRSTVEMGPAPRLRERRPCRDRNPQRSRWWQRGRRGGVMGQRRRR